MTDHVMLLARHSRSHAFSQKLRNFNMESAPLSFKVLLAWMARAVKQSGSLLLPDLAGDARRLAGNPAILCYSFSGPFDEMPNLMERGRCSNAPCATGCKAGGGDHGTYSEADIKLSYLTEMEAGRRNPSIIVVSRIAKALNVTLRTLLD